MKKVIETERLILRPWEVTDAKSLYKYASDSRVSEIALWPTHTSEAMSREVIEKYFQPNPDCFAIIYKDTNEPIGCIGLIPEGEEYYSPNANEREVGYWVGYSHWGKGYATEALKALGFFYKNNSNLKTLLLTTDCSNAASQRVAEKCGFSYIEPFANDGIPNNAYRLYL